MHAANRIVLVGILVLLSGCAAHRVTIHPQQVGELQGSELAPVGLEFEVWQHYWLYGWIQPEELEIGDFCNQLTARVTVETTFLQQVVSVLALQIYTPQTVRIQCVDCCSVRDGSKHNH